MHFLNSLKNKSKHYENPFDHWELSEPLTKESIKEICKTEIVDLSQVNIKYDGTRRWRKILEQMDFKIDEKKGLNMEIDSDGANLSVGLRQLVCFAQA